jgi:hypothetical protein
MQRICRVFISDGPSLRSFYWFGHAPDHSVYFGSSNAKLFRYGYAGSARTSATEGTPIEPTRDGRHLSRDELKDKSSVHGSGVVILATRKGGTRDRYVISAPRAGFEALPLIAIIPMEPARYPVAAKVPKLTDLVLEADTFYGHPFATLFYLTQTRDVEPAPIAGARLRYPHVITKSVAFGANWLFVCVYANPERLRLWSEMEGSLAALPEEAGGKVNWPFIG